VQAPLKGAAANDQSALADFLVSARELIPWRYLLGK
jgi:hypothetical protein